MKIVLCLVGLSQRMEEIALQGGILQEYAYQPINIQLLKYNYAVDAFINDMFVHFQNISFVKPLYYLCYRNMPFCFHLYHNGVFF